jgi:AcrR family transcriptional regulator
MDPEERKRLILDAAYKLARRAGFKKATRAAIAAEAGVSPGLVGVYFGSREDLRTCIMQQAVQHKDKKTIREGLDLGVTSVRIPKELRAA